MRPTLDQALDRLFLAPFLSYELEHLRIAGEMLKQHQGIEPEALVGDTLPTPATFESNRST